MCGEVDSPWRRAWRCKRHADERKRLAPEGLAKYNKELGDEGHPLLSCGRCAKPEVQPEDLREEGPQPAYYLKGQKQEEVFLLNPDDGKIYADGSAHQVKG